MLVRGRNNLEILKEKKRLQNTYHVKNNKKVCTENKEKTSFKRKFY